MKFSKVVKNALAIGNEVKIRGKGMKFSKVVKNALAIILFIFLASCDNTGDNGNTTNTGDNGNTTNTRTNTVDTTNTNTVDTTNTNTVDTTNTNTVDTTNTNTVDTTNTTTTTTGNTTTTTTTGNTTKAFYLASNNITIKCENANNGDTGTINSTIYTKRTKDQITTGNAATSCTSDITDMSNLFRVGTFNGVTYNGTNTFNADISHWDTSSVTNMNNMFTFGKSF